MSPIKNIKMTSLIILAIACACLIAPAAAWAAEQTDQPASQQAHIENATSSDSDAGSNQDDEGDEPAGGYGSESADDASPADQTNIQPDGDTPAPAGTDAGGTEAGETGDANAPKDPSQAPDDTPDDPEGPQLELQPIGVEVYRLFNPATGERFYTVDQKERDTLLDGTWNDEGIGWIAPADGEDVYRLSNPLNGDHHYTASQVERDLLVTSGWRYEGVSWRSGGQQEVFRLFNPDLKTGRHFFTASSPESDSAKDAGWRGEGTAWRALSASSAAFNELIAENSAEVRATLPTVDAGPIQVSTTLVDGFYYLLLPSSADIHALKLSAFRRGLAADLPLNIADYGSTKFAVIAPGDVLDVTEASTTISDNGAYLLWFHTPQTSFIQRLAVMVSAEIASLHIDSVDESLGRAYIESDPAHKLKADVTVTMLSARGAAIYQADTASKPSTIKGRGNSTWEYGDKKPYQISLSRKADLLQTGHAENAQKKWVLLADANDVTLLHNTIAYDLGLELGMTGTECRPVDLYYDSEYRGTYLLCEKIQVKEGRVDIPDLESAFESANIGRNLEKLPTAQARNAFGMNYQFVRNMANPADITGGYLMEIDNAFYASEPCWFQSSLGFIVVKSPEFCSQDAMRYISEYVELAIARLFNNDVSPLDGVRVDLDSLVKTYLVNEYAKNIDAFYSSTYLYKRTGASPLVFEPLWDFDGSLGTRADDSTLAFAVYAGFVLPHADVAHNARATALSSVEIVRKRAREIWRAELAPLIENVLLSPDAGTVGKRGHLRSLAFYRNRIAASEKMNEALFGLTNFGNCLDPFPSYELNFAYLQNWLSWRARWISDNIADLHDGLTYDSQLVYGGIDYSLVFDASCYKRAASLPAYTSSAQAFEHFVTRGMNDGAVASLNFDAKAYRSRYADLEAAFGDDMASYYKHYISRGFYEGRTAV